MEGDNSNPLYQCNASQMFSYCHLRLQIYQKKKKKKMKGDNLNSFKIKNLD